MLYVHHSLPPSQSLLMANTTWSMPRLIELPHQYYLIFQSYSQKSCVTCGEVPNDPAICLVCGNYTCFRQNCCTQQGVSECVHVSWFYPVTVCSMECGGYVYMLSFLLQHSIQCVRGRECLHAVVSFAAFYSFYSVCQRDRMFTCCRFFCSILFSVGPGQACFS